MSIDRGNIDFVGHQRIKVEPTDIHNLPPINNVIYKARTEDELWIEQITDKIGDWRAIFRSSYICWALSINGLFLAQNKYNDPTWSEKNSFQVSTLRSSEDRVQQAIIAKWTGAEAADAHIKTIPRLVTYGIVDLYGCLEEFVFDIYRIYLTNNPEILLKGSEFRELRRLYKNQKDDSVLKDEWNTKWNERLDAWQMKKLYDGLDSVFLALCNHTNLKAPTDHKHTTVQTWSEIIKGIGSLRNCISHGAKMPSNELAEFSEKPYSIGFDFVAGEPIRVDLEHLQAIEMFCDYLLTSLNRSLIELARRKTVI